MRKRINSPRAGIGVFVFKNGKFLILKRTGSHSGGTWSVPSGYLEFSENPNQPATKETKEETNCEIKNITFTTMTDNYFKSKNKHYIIWWTMSEWKSNEPIINESYKLKQKLVNYHHI